MKPSVIVWDLETVPDLPGFAAANDLVGRRDADVREALGNKFPQTHLPHHRLHRRAGCSPRERALGTGRAGRAARGRAERAAAD
jgi:hypothetical protein